MEGVGELNITRGPVTCRDGHEMCAEWLWINLADPRITISDTLLREMLIYGCGPHADLRPGPDVVVPEKPDDASLDGLSAWFEQVAGNLEGWLLNVHGLNQTVIYRITGKVHSRLAWYAEWPD